MASEDCACAARERIVAANAIASGARVERRFFLSIGTLSVWKEHPIKQHGRVECKRLIYSGRGSVDCCGSRGVADLLDGLPRSVGLLAKDGNEVALLGCHPAAFRVGGGEHVGSAKVSEITALGDVH